MSALKERIAALQMKKAATEDAAKALINAPETASYQSKAAAEAKAASEAKAAAEAKAAVDDMVCDCLFLIHVIFDCFLSVRSSANVTKPMRFACLIL